jgi:hemerythrin-like domain-containing protein
MPVRVDNPILLLRREHAEALVMLDHLDAALHDLTAPGASVAVEKAIAFLDEEVRAHNEREEESLFPALEKYLPRSGPTAQMRSEHREFWNLLSAFKAALRDKTLSPGGPRKQGLGVVNILRNHIEKENQFLFPMAQQLLSAEEKAGVARKMEELIEARDHASAEVTASSACAEIGG